MIRSALLALALALAASPSLAQSVKNGGLSGQLLSGSASALTGGTDATILTTPANGVFVLTQICTMGTPGANNENNAFVAGGTIGRIAQVYGSDALGSCTSYAPGIALPSSEELRCVQAGASPSAVTCSVTGVVSAKK